MLYQLLYSKSKTHRPTRTHLINEGVDCFLATEDLRGGENFAEKIAEAIRRYDRLVVLISKQSLESGWVASEVEIALEQERLRGNVIIPISLDEAFRSSDKQWVKEMKRKHIIGFKTRGQIPSYFKALSNLLNALERKDSTSIDKGESLLALGQQ